MNEKHINETITTQQTLETLVNFSTSYFSMNVDANRNITAPITGIFHRGLLFVNTLVTIPIYSILYFKILYWTSLYYSYHYNRYILTGFLAYTVYIIVDPSPKRGGWSHFPSKWQRWCNNFTCFRLLAEFFDAKIIREKELDPKQQYMFMYHPHGLISVGLCATLATNGADFEANFPGVERKSVTLNATFLTPFYREWILANGFISADKSTLVKTLQTKSLILVPGGAVEALYCQPGTMKLYLKNRKGFIRLAMETNKPLIPCIGFGENEIFDTVSPTDTCSNGTGGVFPSLQFGWIRFQRWFMSQTGVALPLVIRPIPRASKIRVVVGSPLLLDNSLSVDENHRIYVESLTKLYHRHAGTLGYGNVELEIG